MKESQLIPGKSYRIRHRYSRNETYQYMQGTLIAKAPVPPGQKRSRSYNFNTAERGTVTIDATSILCEWAEYEASEEGQKEIQNVILQTLERQQKAAEREHLETIGVILGVGPGRVSSLWRPIDTHLEHVDEEYDKTSYLARHAFQISGYEALRLIKRLGLPAPKINKTTNLDDLTDLLK